MRHPLHSVTLNVYFILPIEQAVEDLHSDLEQGLLAEAVAQRYETYSWNALSFKAGKPPWLRFLLSFHQPLL